MFSQSVNRCLNKARNYADKGDFYSAANKYEIALAKDPRNYYANFEYGLLQSAKLNNVQKAGKHLFQALAISKKDTAIELCFELGQFYHFKEKYDSATYYYNRALAKCNSEEEAALFSSGISRELESCKYATSEQGKSNKRRLIIENLGNQVNTHYPEYVPVVTPDSAYLLFTTRRLSSLSKKIDRFDDKYFEDMFVSKIISNGNANEATSVPAYNSQLKNISNALTHESVIGFSHDSTILLTYLDNNLYQCFLQNDGTYSKPQKMDSTINFGEYNNHACLSSDKKTIYFSSDKFNHGKGDLDIYKSTLKENGTWSYPENLGDSINTDYDDQSPEIAKDGNTFYFASKGHIGYGGYDLFSSKIKNGQFLKAQNMGIPINSPGDDIHLKINSNETDGYFSSSRIGGYGDMDIYHMKLNRSKFYDCKPFQNKTYSVKFDASKSLDTAGKAIKIKWVFDKDVTDSGLVIKHVFDTPGQHTVSIDAVDNVTGRIEVEDAVRVITIDSVNHVGFLNKKTIVLGDSAVFDASPSFINGTKITNYHWQINDSVLNTENKLVSYNFTKPGTQKVKLEVITKNGDAFCNEQTCVVVNKPMSSSTSDEDLAALLLNQNKLANDELINISEKDTALIKLLSTLKNNSKFNLLPIYFDFDKHNIRADAAKQLNENYSVLEANKDVTVIITAHCDARGSKEYNIALSKRRSAATIEYLKNKGLAVSRVIQVLNFGESKHVNECGDNVACSTQKHQLNRRVEFLIVNLSKKN